jgi:hypothetical protein
MDLDALKNVGWLLPWGGLFFVMMRYVQAAAMEQTELLLRPYREVLLSDPRGRLPVPRNEGNGLPNTKAPVCNG